MSVMIPDPHEFAALLPSDFRVGVATAALQIEDAVSSRGRSVWDDFADRPGVIIDGSTPSATTDHIRRWREDVQSLVDLGLDAYRFSISWPRIQPSGSGALNEAGMSFYERLVDSLLDAGIRPMATLFHWDTPSELQSRGGWAHPDTAKRFADYACMVGQRLCDRVPEWATINEPATVVLEGHAIGVHAPGQSRLYRAIPVAKQLLLGHGLAVRALRAAGATGRVGLANVHSPVQAASESRSDHAMAGLFDLVFNRLFADPVLLGRMPDVPRALPLGLRVLLGRLLRTRSSDLAVMSEPIDFYGLNYYFPSRIGAGERPSGHMVEVANRMRGVPFHFAEFPEFSSTSFGWPIAPEGLRWTLQELAARYGDRLPPVIVTEQGASFHDEVVDGYVNDTERTAAIADHIRVAAASVAGVTVEGIHIWTLVDNWEWTAGFTQRFGIVHFDRATGARVPKRSALWLRDMQASRSRA